MPRLKHPIIPGETKQDRRKRLARESFRRYFATPQGQEAQARKRAKRSALAQDIRADILAIPDDAGRRDLVGTLWKLRDRIPSIAEALDRYTCAELVDRYLEPEDDTPGLLKTLQRPSHKAHG